MAFFETVKNAHGCKSMKEAARISASLLEENFNTVYYWAKGLSTLSQEINHHGKAYWKTFCNG